MHASQAYHRCPLCPLKYKRASDLNRHMKKKHNIRLREYFTSEQQEPLDLSVKPVQIPRYTNNLDQPMDLTVKPFPDLTVKPKPSEGSEGLKCTHCQYVAKWPSVLQRHMLVHSLEKKFKCPMCQHTGNDRGQRHKRHHPKNIGQKN